MASSTQPPSPAVAFLAGAVAGALAKTTIAPLDRTKISFQVSHKRFSFQQAVWFIKDTYHQQGLFGLWRGNSATMLRVIPFAATQFMAHEQYKTLLRPPGTHGALPPVQRFIAGSLAGATATMATYPLDLVRARMAVTAKDRYQHVLAVVRQRVLEQGLRGLWLGITPTLMGIVPYAGTSFFTFETLKKHYIDHYSSAPSTSARLLFGALAGLLGQNVSYPLDIVRRRMQTQGLVSSVPYKTIVFTLLHVWRSEGARGLYKGVSMNWLKGPLAVSISFNTYDIITRLLQRQT